MVLWGPVVIKSVEAIMEIEESGDKNVYKYEIPKVWVQFRGLPDDLLEFPIIWAVGSILGSTRMVDMKFTNEHRMARMKVAVLAPELIPDLVDVVIGDYVYELQFRIEKDNGDNPAPIYMDIDPKNDEDNGGNLGEKEDDPNNAKTNETHAANKNNLGNIDGTSPTMGSSHTGAAHESTPHSSRVSKPVVKLAPTGSQGSWKAKVSVSPDDLQNTLLGQQQVKPNNLPADAYTSPIRSSKRNAAANDEDSLERATKLKAKRNLDAPHKNGTDLFSLAPLDDSTIFSNIDNVGVSLGSSVNFSTFVNELKWNELSKLRVSVLVNRNLNDDLVDVGVENMEMEEEFDRLALNLLCGDLVEGVSDGDCEPLFALQDSPRNKNSSFGKRKKNKKRANK